jgi:hypothetical protein
MNLFAAGSPRKLRPRRNNNKCKLPHKCILKLQERKLKRVKKCSVSNSHYECDVHIETMWRRSAKIRAKRSNGIGLCLAE